MKLITLAFIAAALGGCDSSSQRPAVRAALEQSALTLRESLGIAATHVPASAPLSGALVLGENPLFSIGTVAETRLSDVDVDAQSGAVLSIADAGTAQGPCARISLDAALGIAEQEKGGEAVMVVPDDDVACAFEIQVLVGETLWEVKVGSDGAILETELSDEYGGSEDGTD